MPRQRHGVIDYIIEALGAIFIILGFLFRISARGYKEEKCNNGHALVKDGPYAIVRNPMYFGTFLIGAGVIMMLLRLWILFLFAAIYFAIYFPQIRKEEKMLIDRFGREYEAYCRTTPRCYPKAESILNMRRYISLKPFWIQKEMFSMIPTIIIVALIKLWEHLR